MMGCLVRGTPMSMWGLGVAIGCRHSSAPTSPRGPWPGHLPYLILLCGGLAVPDGGGAVPHTLVWGLSALVIGARVQPPRGGLVAAGWLACAGCRGCRRACVSPGTDCTCSCRSCPPTGTGGTWLCTPCWLKVLLQAGSEGDGRGGYAWDTAYLYLDGWRDRRRKI